MNKFLKENFIFCKVFTIDKNILLKKLLQHLTTAMVLGFVLLNDNNETAVKPLAE